MFIYKTLILNFISKLFKSEDISLNFRNYKFKNVNSSYINGHSRRVSIGKKPINFGNFSHGHRRRRAVSFRLCLTQEEE